IEASMAATGHEAQRLSEPVAALSARRSSSHHHARLLLLAGLRVAAAVALPRVALRRPPHLRRADELQAPVPRRRVSALGDHELRLLVRGHLRGAGAGAAARLDGQRQDPRARRLPLAAVVAVRHRAGHRRHHLAVRLPPVVRDPAVAAVVRDHVPVQLVPQGLGRDGAHHRGRHLEAVRLQPRLLPGRAAGDRELRAGGGQRGRGGADPALLRDRVPAAVAGDVLPVHAQHDVLVLRHVRPRARRDAGRSRRRDLDHGLPRVERRLRGTAARLLGGAVRRAHGARDRADGGPVPVRRKEGDLLMARTLAQPAAIDVAAGRRVRRRDWHAFTAHAILAAAVALLAFPLYYAFVISTHTLAQVTTMPPTPWPSTALFANYAEALQRAQMGRMLINSAIVALGVAAGKITISLLSAFAIVYFDFRGKHVVFWMIFVTLMLPVPVRIVSTYQVVSVLGWVNTYWGLTVPLMASATGTFLFRQFFRTIPDSLADAAQLDGAGPMRFFWTILLPLSKANMAALFVILFVYGWHDYLWPLMITNTPEMRTAVIGIESLVPRTSQLPEWNVAMAAAMMVLLPPVGVIVVMQRWFVKGLIETEK